MMDNFFDGCWHLGNIQYDRFDNFFDGCLVENSGVRESG